MVASGSVGTLGLMWKRILLTAAAVFLGMSGTTVLAGMLNRAAPVPVDPIALGVELPGVAEPLSPSLPPGPAIPVSPAPVTLDTDGHDLDDDDDADDTDGGGFPTVTPTTSIPARTTTTTADDDSADEADDDDADDDSGDDDVSDDEDDSDDEVGDGDD
jgi:hypothetical protein